MVKKVVTTLLIAGSLFGFNAVEGGTAPTPPATGGNSSQTNALVPAGNYATTYPQLKEKL